MKIPQNIKLKPTFSNKGDDDSVLKMDFKILERSQPIGSVRLYKIHAEESRSGLFITCDTYGETYWCGEAVYDFGTDQYSRNVERLFGGEFEVPIDRDVLYIDKLEIEPPYRGRGIGLLVLLRLMRRYEEKCGLVAIKPYPLQYTNTDIPESSKEFKKDRKKLVLYYSRLGFKKIPNTDYHAFSLEFRLPTEKELFALMPTAQRENVVTMVQAA
jgi:GNAT superfamily N-acetyltransferase